MATNWILNKVSDAIAPTVASTVATAGGYAGDAASAVGSAINGVGQSINSSISAYGYAAQDYGNSIKDMTKSPTARIGTAKNPLGLSDTTTGGQRAVGGSGTPRKAITSSPAASALPQKALSTLKPAAPKSKTAATVKPSTAPAKPRPSSIKTSKATTSSMTGKPPSINSTKSSASSTANKIPSYKSPITPGKKSPVTPRTPLAVRKTLPGSTAEARNPLGL